MSASLNSTAQAEVDAVGKMAPAGSDQNNDYLALLNAIDSTPALVTWLNAAVVGTSPEVKGINYSSSTGSVANYNTGTHEFTFSDGYFQSAIAGGLTSSATAFNLVLLVGHESGHADDSNHVAAAPDITNMISTWTSGPLTTFVHGISSNDDATSTVLGYVKIGLQDEGYANIRGWNDVVDYATSNGLAVDAARKASLGWLLFDESGNPRDGIQLQTNGNGSIDATNTTYQQDAGLFEANVHPSLTVQDAGVTYSHFEASIAINTIELNTNDAAIKLDYSGLGLMSEAVRDPQTVFIDTPQVDTWLVEAGLKLPSGAAEITNTDTGEITRFSAGSTMSASVFTTNAGYAESHLTFDALSGLTERDDYNSDGSVYERHLQSWNSAEQLVSQETAYFTPGEATSSSLSIQDANGNMKELDSFDQSGSLTEQDIYATPGSLGDLLMRSFLSDGSTSISHFSADGTYIDLSATFAKGAQHASNAQTFAADGSNVQETFSATDKLLTATSFDASDNPVQEELFSASGTLSSLKLHLSGGTETWGYDTTGALDSFVTSVGAAHDWVREANGSWFDADTQMTSASQPSSIPAAPPLLTSINADAFALPATFIAPQPLHTVDHYLY